MMPLDKLTMGRMARDLGFVRDTLEKVCRLTEVLRFFESDELLSTSLALKGGTAINLTVLDLPRLSVDIDMDYCKSIDREEMLNDRAIITDRISRFMTAGGYTLSIKSKNYHALDSFVYEYINCGGVKDNLKIEINYMLRCHVFFPEEGQTVLPWNEKKMSVLTVNPVEVFASKTVALLARTAPRDLYDIYNMIRFGILDEDKRESFRKCAVFYSAIGTQYPPEQFVLDNIGRVTETQIKRELEPVLRKGERFELEPVRENVKSFLAEVLEAENSEKLFWKSFREGEYMPELVFQDEADMIRNHPMALWKCRAR